MENQAFSNFLPGAFFVIAFEEKQI
jgi:hypothetical protein